jgi:hypothetical protein
MVGAEGHCTTIAGWGHANFTADVFVREICLTSRGTGFGDRWV